MTRMIVVWTMCYRLGKFALQLGTLIYMRHLMIPTHVILSCEVSWISTCGVFACSILARGLAAQGFLKRVHASLQSGVCVCVMEAPKYTKITVKNKHIGDPVKWPSKNI